MQKKIVLWCLLLILGMPLIAGEGCCFDLCSFGCEPLECGAFSTQIKAGIAQGFYTSRGLFTGIVASPCVEDPAFMCSQEDPTYQPITQLASCIPKQKNLHSARWLVGIELAYNCTNHTQLYAEIFHRQANGKNYGFPCDANPTFIISKCVTNKLRHTGAAFGCRLYSDRLFCNTTSLFAGMKGGFLHRGNEKAFPLFTTKVTFINMQPGVQATTKPIEWTYFLQDTTVITGFHLGFDCKIVDCLSFVFIGELVVAGAYRTACDTPVLDAGTMKTLRIAGLSYGGTGVELFFPVTFGLAYHF